MTSSSQTTAGRSNIAVLIDGDNAQPDLELYNWILTEIKVFGHVTIQRIYGDWTAPQMTPWKNLLHKYAIVPVQQFRNTVKKNCTDSTLIIDAMDILHGKSVQCFCIVSSDSDYTRLATRIRESGLTVIGIGKKTAPAFEKACDRYIVLPDHKVKKSAVAAPNAQATVTKVKVVKPGGASKDVQKSGFLKEASPGTKSKAKVPSVEKTEKMITLPLALQNPTSLEKAFKTSKMKSGWAKLKSLRECLKQLEPDAIPEKWHEKEFAAMLINHGFEVSSANGEAAKARLKQAQPS